LARANTLALGLGLGGAALVFLAAFLFSQRDASRALAVWGMATAAVAALGWVLAAWQRKRLAVDAEAPLEALRAALDDVARSQDPTRRVPAPEAADVAALAERFNEALDYFESRDQHHANTRRLIEEQLAQRDAELKVSQTRLRLEQSKRKRAQAELAKLASAIAHAADAVMVTSREGLIEYVNPAFERMTGWTREEALGGRPSILKSGAHDEAFYANMWRTVLAGDVYRENVINRRRDGATYHEEKTITPLRDARGQITHFIATGKDISDRIRVQEKLEFMAHHDAVTGLPNRVLLLDRIDQALARGRRESMPVAVLFLDLDGFKAINDTVGHHVGDRLLNEVAGRLQNVVRERDTVARLGGDEFAVVLEGMTSMNSLSGVARKLLNAVASPYVIDDRDLYVTTSIGVARFPRDGDDVHTLLRKADGAMYRAKQAGKNTYRFYSQLEGDEDVQRLELEQQLRRAVERREFVVYYQPQVSIDSSSVVGVEALLRWNHPEQGIVEPARFINVLEETGLIVEVGDWVLREVCRQATEWKQQGMIPLRFAVNVSARQFGKRDIVGDVARVLDETGMEPKRIHIEITEGTIASKFEQTVEVMRKLNALGVRIAVDDFGVGYSSLNYLKRLPIHTLKIDQSFIRDVTTDPNDAAIARTIIALAHNLGLDVIAEGVETLEQLFFLSRQGCHEVQGHLISRPLPADEFAAWLADNQRVRVRRTATG
jgi:diguanylate cyclase (GGDEF)-like protein/PAS domain S-box-containing protein